MYYILVIDGKAHESIPEYDVAFPGVPIEARYAKEALSECVRSEEVVEIGWLYDAESGTFSAPPEPDPVMPPSPTPPQPTPQEDADGIMVDHEYRLTLLELGVGEGVK